MSFCCVALRTMSNHLWWIVIMWENRRYTCMYNWVTILYSRKKNCIGEITISNNKKFKKRNSWSPKGKSLLRCCKLCNISLVNSHVLPEIIFNNILCWLQNYVPGTLPLPGMEELPCHSKNQTNILPKYAPLASDILSSKVKNSAFFLLFLPFFSTSPPRSILL